MGVVDTIKARSTSVSAWKLPREESCIAPDDVWSNKGNLIPVITAFVLIRVDMDPSPPEYRRWTTWTFFTCESPHLLYTELGRYLC